MAADMQILDGQVFDPGRRAKAEQRAERIVSHLASAADEIAQAILAEDWTAMGLSPEEWRAQLFGDKRLTVEARRQVHQLLSAEGMSTRQIAAATGTSQKTAARDVSHSDSPRPDQQERYETAENVTPKPPAQRMRESRQRKKEQEASPGPVPPGVTNATTKPPAAPGPGPQPHVCTYAYVCTGCGKPDRAFSSSFDAIEARDKAKDAQIARLSEQVTELERQARLSAAPDGFDLDDLDTEPDAEPDGSDSAHGRGRPASAAGPCAGCGNPGTPLLYDGEETGKFACDRCYRKAAAKGQPVTRRAA